MNPQTFLTLARGQWRRVADTAFASLSEEDCVALRAMEQQIFELEFAQLTAIVLGCTNRFQFAKTYRVLRADLVRTLSQPTKKDVPAAMIDAARPVFENVGRWKLHQMACWFAETMADAQDQRTVSRKWNESNISRIEDYIEIYAGTENPSGCLKRAAALSCLLITAMFIAISAALRLYI